MLPSSLLQENPSVLNLFERYVRIAASLSIAKGTRDVYQHDIVSWLYAFHRAGVNVQALTDETFDLVATAHLYPHSPRSRRRSLASLRHFLRVLHFDDALSATDRLRIARPRRSPPPTPDEMAFVREFLHRIGSDPRMEARRTAVVMALLSLDIEISAIGRLRLDDFVRDPCDPTVLVGLRMRPRRHHSLSSAPAIQFSAPVVRLVAEWMDARRSTHAARDGFISLSRKDDPRASMTRQGLWKMFARLMGPSPRLLQTILRDHPDWLFDLLPSTPSMPRVCAATESKGVSRTLHSEPTPAL